MMTEATSDESDADSDSSMGPVPLRREETMVCGQAGAVPSYKDEETRTDSWLERNSEKRAATSVTVAIGGAALQERRG